MKQMKVLRIVRSNLHLAVVIVMPFLVFIEPLIRGEVLFWGLPATQFIPWRVFAMQELSRGLLPLWNPFNGLGAPLLANYQLAFFYPPSWILNAFWVVGGVQMMAWGYLLVNVLHLSWAGLGAALFTGSLGAGRMGQAVSGLAFGLSAYFTSRIGTASMIWAGCWLPWLMLGATQIVQWSEDRKKPFPFLPIVAISFQLLAGHAQLTWYSLLLFGIWLLFSLIRRNNHQVLIAGLIATILILIVSVGLAALQLIPTAEYLFVSQRSSTVDYDIGLTYSFWPWRLLTFLQPDFFGNPANGTYFGYASYWEDAVYLGFIPLILAISTIPNFLRKNALESKPKAEVIFFWSINFVALILALGKNTPIFPFLYQYVPSFDMFNGPTRFMIWAEFGIATLAGLAFSRWKRPEGAGLKRLRLLAVGSGAVAAGAGLAWISLGDVRVSFISSTAMVGLMGLLYCILTLIQTDKRMRYGRWEALVVGVVCFDLLINNFGKTPTTAATFYSTPIETQAISQGERIYIDKQDEYLLKFSRFFRFNDFRQIEDWQNLREAFLPNTNLLQHIPLINNFDPLVPGRFAEVFDWLDQIGNQAKLNYLKWMNVGIYERRDASTTMGIRFDQVEPWGEFRWVKCAISTATPQQTWDMTREMISSVSSGMHAYIVLETSVPVLRNHCVGSDVAEIIIEKELSQRVELQLKSDSPGYLVIAKSNYPGWKARIDGIDALILPAEYLFLALPVPAGDHKITLEYAPQSFYIGTVLTGIFIIIVIISGIIIRVRRRTKS